MATIHFDRPARDWLDRLPLGNGALGAMCDGGSPARFALNDETAWSGSPQNERGPDAATARSALADARRALADGDPVAAEASLMALQSPYSQAYLPFAELIVMTQVADGRTESGTATPAMYRRELDLERGLHRVESGRVRESTFLPVESGVLVHLVEGAEITGLVIETPLRELERFDDGREHAVLVRLPSDVAPGHEPDFPAATWDDTPGAALEGAVVARLLRDSGRAWVLVATATTYAGIGLPPEGDARSALAAARSRLDAAEARRPDELLAAHVAGHTALMRRVRLELGGGTRADEMPTDVRLERAAASRHPLAADPALAALLFDYGRYLLAASSRPGGLPATLQGIWNDRMQPPWSSNYTLNINTQMNYWAAAVADLPECQAPFADLVSAVARSGSETARRLYDAPGWVAHHNTDAWAFTGLAGAGHGDARWAFWPMAAPWLVQQLWEPVAFGQAGADEAATWWPMIRGAAEFALAWQRAGPDGSWETAPATSPENAYITDDGRAASLDTTTAMDRSLLRTLFRITDECAALTGRSDDPIAVAARDRLARLPAAPEIAPDGTIVEWSRLRREEDPHHRHLSPLFGLYPGEGAWDAAHRAAAAATLQRRGDDSSGWSLAWKLALWARLGRGDKVGDILRLLFRPAREDRGPWAAGLYANLFAAHPPFQLDGNLGFVAGLAEALLQSHNGIELLPALPPELPDGSVEGLVARPGLTVGMRWAGGALVEASLSARTPEAAGEHMIRWRGKVLRRLVAAGDATRLTAADFAAA